MQSGMNTIAELMAVSARTAPKSRGKDFVEIRIIQDEDCARLADAMESYGNETGKRNFDRDGAGVRACNALVLLSLNEPAVAGLDCGACGVDRCADLKARTGPEFDGPLCAWRLIDLGIALGSAVKTASFHNADNRIMYRAGVAARRIGMIQGEIVVAIPISATGKNIFFDR